MTITALRSRQLDDTHALFTSDTGAFFKAAPCFASRVSEAQLSEHERDFLRLRGYLEDQDDRLARYARSYARLERTATHQTLDYLILVPTLRCILSCSYCQVSRVNEARTGFDWTSTTLSAVLDVIDRVEGPRIKIEFQGGEPTLRPDLLNAVMDRCARFTEREFVICTNLQRLDDDVLALFDRPDVFISTSLDGDVATHRRNRTATQPTTDLFRANLLRVVDRYGLRKVSALPTIDAANPPEPQALIEAYASYGLDSIFLRPINYQGFARKRHADAREQDDAWRTYYERFVHVLIARNWTDRSRVLEETYLSIGLRKIFRPGRERHVDLRSPNPMGVDYIVIDHDGRVYPTDEARMLARSGVIDLSLGDVLRAGMEKPARFSTAMRRTRMIPRAGAARTSPIAAAIWSMTSPAMAVSTTRAKKQRSAAATPISTISSSR